MAETPRRRLAAIMFTDLVGFSSLAQQDERGALQLVREQEELAAPHLTSYGGRKIKSTGDGMLIEFSNARDAVEFAVALQRKVHDRNVERRGRPMQIRVGIHLGDVEVANGDILGDAVNIAARIEETADAGAVHVSKQVFDQIHSKVSFRFEKLEPRTLKGIRDPIEVYRATLPSNPTARFSDPLPVNRVAVLPFSNISPDPQDEYFADGLTEEMISELSKTPPLRVIARTSVMRYKNSQQSLSRIAEELNVGTVLEGSVRKAGSRIRITVQLIDARTEEHRWSETYDKDFDDIFAIQSQIAKNVAARLNLTVAPSSLAVQPPTRNLEAYSLYLKGRTLWTNRSNESVTMALKCFEEARDLDPSFPQAYAGIADCYSVLSDNGRIPWSDAGPIAIEAARKAVALDGRSAAAHASLGLALSRQYEWEAAEREFRTAIDLSPGYAPAHHWCYLMLRAQARETEANAELARAMEADPLSPMIWLHYGNRASRDGDDDGALRCLDRALELDPRSEMAYVYKVFLHAEQARMGDALQAFRAFEQLDAERQRNNVWYGLVLVALGRREEARNWASAHSRGPRGPSMHPMAIAWTYGALGEKDQFFAWLSRAQDDVRAGILVILSNPLLENVRSDPRFQEYLHRSRLAG